VQKIGLQTAVFYFYRGNKNTGLDFVSNSL